MRVQLPPELRPLPLTTMVLWGLALSGALSDRLVVWLAAGLIATVWVLVVLRAVAVHRDGPQAAEGVGRALGSHLRRPAPILAATVLVVGLVLGPDSTWRGAAIAIGGAGVFGALVADLSDGLLAQLRAPAHS